MKHLLEKLPKKVKVGNKFIGEGEPVFFIAEIGNNHNGDYFLAKRSIERAIQSGADAVKLQKRFIDDLFTKEMRDKPQTKDQMYGNTYGEYRKALELNHDEFVKLKEFSEKLGTIFFATPFYIKSVDFLENIGVSVYKVASFDVTNIPLLEYVAKKGKPMFLSSGMSTMEELDEAISTILKYNDQLVVKHCVSVYPTPDDKLNMMSVPFMKERYNPIPIGYSGHEKDILPSLLAVALGAKSVERHFTLDKDMPGPDHATVSIEPEEFYDLVQKTRRLEKSFGVPVKELFPDELKTREKHSKSITSKTEIPAGTMITAEMITCKSPGHGLKPNMISRIIGRRAKSPIPDDTTMLLDHIEW
ncbi:MAG: N-acetylneuraminate synthase family protein [Patescibacteria group bacterium]